MATRRAPGEGSIFRRSDGLWVARITVDGKRLQKTGKRQADVKRWLHEKRAQAADGLQLTAGRTTISAFFDHWLEISRPNWRPRTANHHAQIARDHIIPILGDVRLDHLRPDHVQALYTQKSNAGASPHIIRQIHITLHAALTKAVRWNLITRNPADAVDRPQLPNYEKPTFNADQVRRLLQAADGHRAAPLIRLALATGARLGELLGLFWTDLDLAAGTVTFRRQLQRLPQGQGLVFTEPKTRRSARTIPLDPATVEILRSHQQDLTNRRLLLGDVWREYDLVFPSRIGTPLEPRRAYTEFQQMLDRAGLPRTPFHALRHTSATLLIRAGQDIKTVSERLGHSDIGITLSTYTHPDDTDHRQAADAIGKILHDDQGTPG